MILPEKETRNIKENRFFKSSVWIVLNFACQLEIYSQKSGIGAEEGNQAQGSGNEILLGKDEGEAVRLLRELQIWAGGRERR